MMYGQMTLKIYKYNFYLSKYYTIREKYILKCSIANPNMQTLHEKLSTNDKVMKKKEHSYLYK